MSRRAYSVVKIGHGHHLHQPEQLTNVGRQRRQGVDGECNQGYKDRGQGYLIEPNPRWGIRPLDDAL